MLKHRAKCLLSKGVTSTKSHKAKSWSLSRAVKGIASKRKLQPSAKAQWAWLKTATKCIHQLTKAVMAMLAMLSIVIKGLYNSVLEIYKTIVVTSQWLIVKTLREIMRDPKGVVDPLIHDYRDARAQKNQLKIIIIGKNLQNLSCSSWLEKSNRSGSKDHAPFSQRSYRPAKFW